MARPGFFNIPTQVLEDQQRAGAADDWAQQQRSQVADDWAAMHTQDYLSAANEITQQAPAMPQATPGPGPFSNPNQDAQLPDAADPGSPDSAGGFATNAPQDAAGAGLPTDQAGMNAELGRLAQTQQGPKLTPGDVVAGAPAGVADVVGAAPGALAAGRDAFNASPPGQVIQAGLEHGNEVNQRLAAGDPDAVQEVALNVAGGPGPEIEKAAGQVAAKVLPKMAGTVEQAAALAPEAAGDAANILLSKFSPEVRPLLQTAADTFNSFAGQRRGVVTDDQAATNAAGVALGTTVQDWLKTPPGKAFNQEQAIALGQTLEHVGQDFNQARDAFQQAVQGGTATDQQRADLASKALQFAALEGVRSGAAAEAGRALRSFQTILDGSISSGLGVDRAVQRAFKAIGTDPEAFQQWTAAWKMIPADDVTAQYKQLQLLRQPQAMSKVLAYTMNNLLSSTKTQEIVAAHGLVQALDRPVVELLRGNPADALTDVVAMGRAVGTAFHNAAEAFLGGVGPTQATMALAHDLPVRPNAFPGKAGLVVTPALRSIGALHEFWASLSYAGAQAAEAARVARSSGRDVADVLANPPPGFVEKTATMAESAARGGQPSVVAQQILNLRGYATRPDATGGQRFVGLAAHALFPFVSIPDYIFRNGAKITAGPVAYPALAATHALQGDLGKARGDLMVGAATAAVDTLIYSLAAQGNLTGDGPSDPHQRATLEAATDEKGNPVWQQHSIKVGGRWVDYTSAGGVFAVPMAAIANAVEAYNAAEQKPKNAGEFTPIAVATANATVKAMSDATYIRNFAGLVRNFFEGTLVKPDLGQGVASTFAGSTLDRLVPESGLLAEGTRALDQNVKQPGNIPEQIASRIPGLSLGVKDKVEPTTGGSVQAPQDAVSTLLPGRASAQGQPNTAAAVLAAHGVGVTPQRNATSGQVSVALTPGEQRQVTEMAGPEIQRRVQAVTSSPSFASRPPAQQKQLLERAVQQAHEAAGAQFLRQLGGQEVRARYAGKKAA